MQTQTNKITSTEKAFVHLIVIPILLAIVMAILTDAMAVIVPISYMFLIVLYFNLKAEFVKKLDVINDKFRINELAMILVTTVIGIITVILFLAIL